MARWLSARPKVICQLSAMHSHNVFSFTAFFWAFFPVSPIENAIILNIFGQVYSMSIDPCNNFQDHCWTISSCKPATFFILNLCNTNVIGWLKHAAFIILCYHGLKDSVGIFSDFADVFLNLQEIIFQNKCLRISFFGGASTSHWSKWIFYDWNTSWNKNLCISCHNLSLFPFFSFFFPFRIPSGMGQKPLSSTKIRFKGLRANTAGPEAPSNGCPEKTPKIGLKSVIICAVGATPLFQGFARLKFTAKSYINLVPKLYPWNCEFFPLR